MRNKTVGTRHLLPQNRCYHSICAWMLKTEGVQKGCSQCIRVTLFSCKIRN